MANICSVHKFENVDFGILGLDSCKHDESKEEKLFDFFILTYRLFIS